jgi:hypothetical protein
MILHIFFPVPTTCYLGSDENLGSKTWLKLLLDQRHLIHTNAQASPACCLMEQDQYMSYFHEELRKQKKQLNKKCFLQRSTMAMKTEFNCFSVHFSQYSGLI